MNKFKNIIFILVVVILVFLTVNILSTQDKSSILNSDNSQFITDNTNEIISFQLIIDTGSKETKNYLVNFIPGQNLEEIMTSFSTNNNSFNFITKTESFGTFITTINGIKADSTKEFWNFKINGSDSSVGITDFEPQNNDIILFTLTTF